MPILAQFSIMLLAATLEVGGDALIRRGLNVGGAVLVAAGCVVLGSYGVLVNLIRLDFSRLLGAYVGWFAVVSFAFGRIVFGDRISWSTWIGLAIVLLGSLMIQLGPTAPRWG